MFKLRNATLEDMPSCLVCAEKFVAYYGFNWNKTSVEELLVHIINDGIFTLAETDGKVVAGIGGGFACNPWDKAQVIFQEMFWWVDEEYRDGSLGIKLLKTLEAQIPNTTTLVLCTLPKSNIKQETLAKLGYSLREQAYTRN
jgi:hypothetical protein